MVSIPNLTKKILSNVNKYVLQIVNLSQCTVKKSPPVSNVLKQTTESSALVLMRYSYCIHHYDSTLFDGYVIRKPS